MDKKFKKPELEFVLFSSEDIIVTSTQYGAGEDAEGNFWENGDMGGGN